jgi:polar amino acid transport system substrate-binding protein
MSTSVRPSHTRLRVLPRAPAGTRAGPLRRLLVAATLLLGVGCSPAVEADTADDSVYDAVMERGVLRAGIRFDNPPHSFIRDGEWIGFDLDIAQALAEELGVELDPIRVDELTRISFLQNGRIDAAVASMSQTVERHREVDFSQTYFCANQTFLVTEGEAADLHDLADQRVGVSRGSHALGNWRDWLTTNGYSVDPDRIVEFDSKEAAAEAVQQGAIAGWAEDYTILTSFARRLSGLTVLEEQSIGSKLDGIGVVEDDSRWRDAVNFALQRVIASGRYDDTYDRWFGPDSETPVPRQCALEVWPLG